MEILLFGSFVIQLFAGLVFLKTLFLTVVGSPENLAGKLGAIYLQLASIAFLLFAIVFNVQ